MLPTGGLDRLLARSSQLVPPFSDTYTALGPFPALPPPPHKSQTVVSSGLRRPAMPNVQGSLLFRQVAPSSRVIANNGWTPGCGLPPVTNATPCGARSRTTDGHPEARDATAPTSGWTAERVQLSEPIGDVNSTHGLEGSGTAQSAIAHAVAPAGSSAATGELNTRFQLNPRSWLS